MLSKLIPVTGYQNVMWRSPLPVEKDFGKNNFDKTIYPNIIYYNIYLYVKLRIQLPFYSAPLCFNNCLTSIRDEYCESITCLQINEGSHAEIFFFFVLKNSFDNSYRIIINTSFYYNSENIIFGWGSPFGRPLLKRGCGAKKMRTANLIFMNERHVIYMAIFVSKWTARHRS